MNEQCGDICKNHELLEIDGEPGYFWIVQDHTQTKAPWWFRRQRERELDEFHGCDKLPRLASWV